jgi:hypothetical protein
MSGVIDSVLKGPQASFAKYFLIMQENRHCEGPDVNIVCDVAGKFWKVGKRVVL